jgi:hypothetical protein
MNASWKNRVRMAVAAVGLVAVLAVLLLRSQPVLAQKEGGGGGPRYTVVQTEGTNLIVTDNRNNTLYFYTIDQGKEPGADLKLRATVDLTQVGKEVIKPVLSKK